MAMKQREIPWIKLNHRFLSDVPGNDYGNDNVLGYFLNSLENDLTLLVGNSQQTV